MFERKGGTYPSGAPTLVMFKERRTDGQTGNVGKRQTD
jgi:hypothetical protein